MGYFSPIGGSAHPESGTHPLDRHLRLVHDAFELRSDVRSMFGVPEDEAVRLVASGRRPELIDRIYAAYAAYKDTHDVVLVQGTSLGSGKLDAEIAGALNAPAIIACQVRHAGWLKQSRWWCAEGGRGHVVAMRCGSSTKQLPAYAASPVCVSGDTVALSNVYSTARG